MHAVAPYLVEIKDEQKQSQDLWRFSGSESLYSVLLDYFHANLGKYQPSLSQADRMFMVAKLFAGSSESICGAYQTGQHGFESDIYSTSKKKVTHKRLTDEADMMPFNFAFYMHNSRIRAQRARGLLMLARFNTLGVRHITISHLQQYFKNRFPGFTLEINRVVPKVVLESILQNGALKTIRLIRKTLPQDVADALSDGDRDRVQDVELVIRSKRRSRFSDVDWIYQILDGRANMSDVVTIPSFPHDGIKLEVQMDGSTRTVDLGNTSKLSSNIELESVAVGLNGHPVNESWLEEVDSIAAGVVESWGAGKPNWKSLV